MTIDLKKIAGVGVSDSGMIDEPKFCDVGDDMGDDGFWDV